MAEQTGSWRDCLAYAAVTHIGMRRENNQDAYAVVLAEDAYWISRGHLFLVADGMGAHAAGELASELVATGIPHHYHKFTEEPPPEALRRAFEAANAEVYRRGRANTDFLHMGTTASALVLLPGAAWVAHIGDSRVYRLRGGELEQLTFDHSLVWEMRAAGQLSANSELLQAIPRNVITRSLGPNAAVDVDVEGPFSLEAGDVFLICTDGLTTHVDDEELAAVLASLPPLEAARLLVDWANARGGADNTTVVVVRLTGEPPSAEAAAARGARPGRRARRWRLHPAWAVASGAGWLGALGLLAAGEPAPAASMAVLGGLLFACGLLVGRPRPRNRVQPAAEPTRTAPYSRTEQPSVSWLAGRLRTLAGELQAATGRDGDLVARHWRDAAEAEQAGRAEEAVRQYGAGLHLLIERLRRQKK